MLLSSLKSLMLIRTDLIFYILAAVFFCAFLVVLLWYLLSVRKSNNPKPTKTWTIESAKKFLESNNIKIDEESNKKANENTTNATNIEETDNSNKLKQKKSTAEKKAVSKKSTKAVKQLKNNFK